MTKIQWTDKTTNPITVATGGHWCQKISAGCANCYAESINIGNRFDFASGLKYTGQAPRLKFDYTIPASWSRMRSPKRIFVCSMTDLFGHWVERDWQMAIFDGAAAAPRQTIQILTKRPAIAASAAIEWCQRRNCTELPSNVWMGVTAENQATALERIPVLQAIPASVRFISAEPLISPIKWDQQLLEGIHWLILGGESGPGARHCDVNWIQEAVTAARRHGVAPFVKQLGSRPTEDGHPIKVKGKGGDPDALAFYGLNIRKFQEAA